MIERKINWPKDFDQFGHSPDSLEAIYDRLEALYSEPHRTYHNYDHINDMLALADTVVGISDPVRRRLKLAIVYHDAVYYPQSKFNEELSAALFVNDAWGIMAVERAILATKNHFSAEHDDDMWEVQALLDFDLMGMSKPWADFLGNTSKIWAEYMPTTPWKAFVDGRLKFLTYVSEQKSIYRLPEHQHLNAQAFDNIRREISLFEKEQKTMAGDLQDTALHYLLTITLLKTERS